MTYPVAFKQIVGPHTAEAVGSFVADILKPFLGKGFLFLIRVNFVAPDSFPFAGVVDGGDIASVKFTAQRLNCVIKDNTCICHKLNNLIKRMLGDYFEEIYLNEWRVFVQRTNQSNPFKEAWEKCCLLQYDKKIILQKDTPTRYGYSDIKFDMSKF